MDALSPISPRSLETALFLLLLFLPDHSLVAQALNSSSELGLWNVEEIVAGRSLEYMLGAELLSDLVDGLGGVRATEPDPNEF